MDIRRHLVCHQGRDGYLERRFYGIPMDTKAQWYWRDSRDGVLTSLGGYATLWTYDGRGEILWTPRMIGERFIYLPNLVYSKLFWLNIEK